MRNEPQGPTEATSSASTEVQTNNLVDSIIRESKIRVELVRQIRKGEIIQLNNSSYRRAWYDPAKDEGLEYFLQELQDAKSKGLRVEIVQHEGMIDLWVELKSR